MESAVLGKMTKLTYRVVWFQRRKRSPRSHKPSLGESVSLGRASSPTYGLRSPLPQAVLLFSVPEALVAEC